jgi:hypothetical protein
MTYEITLLSVCLCVPLIFVRRHMISLCSLYVSVPPVDIRKLVVCVSVCLHYFSVSFKIRKVV